MAETRNVTARFKARIILNPVREDNLHAIRNPDYVPFDVALEASSVYIDYAINQIPTASIQLAVGRKNASDLETAIGHISSRRLLRRIDLIIEVQADGETGGPKDPKTGIAEQWPDDFFTIFDGYTTGAQVMRAVENNSYKINATNWLGALTDSSVLSSRLHPSAPGPLFINTTPFLLFPDAGVVNKIFARFEQEHRVREDLWGFGILPVLRELAEDEQADVTILDELDKVVAGTRDGNKAGLAALDRFETFSTDVLSDDDEFKAQSEFMKVADLPLDPGELPPTLDSIRLRDFGEKVLAGNAPPKKELEVMPLALVDELSPIVIENQILAVLDSVLTREARLKDTFWDRILLGAYNFMFSIVPAVNKAVAAPILPMGSRDPHVFIGSSEIFSIQGTAEISRLPRGMALWDPDPTGPTGILQGWAAGSPARVVFPGIYDLTANLEAEIKDRRGEINREASTRPIAKAQLDALEAYAETSRKGLWKFAQIPSWIADFDVFDSLVDATIRPKQQEGEDPKAPSKATATGLEPAVEGLEDTAGREESKDVELEAAKEPEMIARSEIGKRFAHMSLMDDIFKSRNIILSGRFRVDIAPGSTIRLETMGENIADLPFGGVYTGKLQGLVTQVTLQLDAENATAATSFAVSHVKNEAEIVSKVFSPEGHPLYRHGVYKGNDLVPKDDTGKLRSIYNERRAAAAKVQAAAAEKLKTITEDARALMAKLGTILLE